MADRVVITERGEAKCCKGRMYTITANVDGKEMVTNRCEHTDKCKSENPASAKWPVGPKTRKRAEPRAERKEPVKKAAKLEVTR